MKKGVGVIFGGQSPEHEVSRVSAQYIISNIDKEKYDVEMIGITKDGKWLVYDGPVEELGTGRWQTIAEDKKGDSAISIDEIFAWGKPQTSNTKHSRKVDVIFPALHGCNGEDGTIQGLFEIAGIPYVGCGVLSSAVCMDKAFSKLVFKKHSIPHGKYIVINRNRIRQDTESIIEEVEDALEYPCFVKPSNTGSSIGVSKARNRQQLTEALYIASKYDRKILVEEFINGREFECAVLGNQNPIVSVVGEIVPCNEFYDYEAKYSLESTSKIIIPACLPEEVSDSIREYALKAFEVLECSGLARADFFVQNATNKVYINELNTLPGFTNISMYPKLWEATGIKYSELIDRLIDLAFERFRENNDEFDML
jgi:D-alanine-D-alanine ligase